MFEFKTKYKELDDRSKFANKVCQLLLNKHQFSTFGDISDLVEEIKEIKEYFEEHVDNIHELVDSEIPLFALYELKNNGAENYGFTEEEYSGAMVNCLLACKIFYNI